MIPLVRYFPGQGVHRVFRHLFKLAKLEGVGIPKQGTRVFLNLYEKEEGVALRCIFELVAFADEQFHGLGNDAPVGHDPVGPVDFTNVAPGGIARLGALSFGEVKLEHRLHIAGVAANAHRDVVEDTLKVIAIATSTHAADVQLVTRPFVFVAVVGPEVSEWNGGIRINDGSSINTVDEETVSLTDHDHDLNERPFVHLNRTVGDGVPSKTVFRGEGHSVVVQVEAPSIIAFHHHELVGVEAVGVDPGREFKMGHVGHVQVVVVVKNHVVALAVKSERIVGTRSNFDHAVNREILRVVFQVVPRAGVDVPHVGAGDVNVVLITAFRGLVLAPISVEERRAVVPAVVARIVVGQTRPQVARLVVPGGKRFEQPGVFLLVIYRDEETVQRSCVRGRILPRRSGEQVVGVVVSRVHCRVENTHSIVVVRVGRCGCHKGGCKTEHEKTDQENGVLHGRYQVGFVYQSHGSGTGPRTPGTQHHDVLVPFNH